MSVQEHFETGMCAFDSGRWDEAVQNLIIVAVNFPESPYAQESHYFIGVAYFNLEEYDFANGAFTNYLRSKHNPRFFMETIQYKFEIAERLKNGAKRRFFGKKELPKWATGNDLAVQIYDEVAAALPCHEIAAQALFSKAHLLWSMKDYKEGVEAFRTITKRFPKNELAPESYLLINQIYLDQSRTEFQNPDILAFAQLNLRRFQHDFPREPRLSEAEAGVMEIKEVYARGLFDTAEFYGKIGKPMASAIYYQNAINQFPDTQIAELCRSRLAVLARNGVVSILEPQEPVEQSLEELEEAENEFDENHLTELDSEGFNS
jgi:outer membrane protein assembly factor BamD (BamD/ComL family)